MWMYAMFMLKISRSIRLIPLSTKLYPDQTEASMKILMEKLKQYMVKKLERIYGVKVGKTF